MKDHLLGRLLGRNCGETFTPADHLTIRIQNETIFQVHTARINYTTYDMRRAYDTINPRTHPFVIAASPDDEPGCHPFWYAAVMGIYHANVQHIGVDSRDYRVQKMEFFWVRWLDPVSEYSFGQRQACLPKVRFAPDLDDSSYGFLDPSLVIRGCHLIPAFQDGKMTGTMEGTTNEARACGKLDDWTNYYVGM